MGVTSGIGLATARAAARRGARVVVSARSPQSLDRIVDDILSTGGQAIAVSADVSIRNEVERIADEAIGRFGRIDTWVNNAGMAVYGWLDEVNAEESRRLFDINFWGVVNGSLVALLHLRHSSGAIVNVGSELSDAIVPLQGLYSASNHAVKGFTNALRVEVEEVRKLPVSISLIDPTAIDSPSGDRSGRPASGEMKAPSPRIDPERVATAILHAAEHPTGDVGVGALRGQTLWSRIATRRAGR